VIYFPPIDMFQVAQDFDALDIRQRFIPLAFIPRSGRAFVWPVYRGTGSRYFGLMEMEAHQRSALQTDLREHWYADAKRTIDYLETREDINTDALAYLGFSYGASMMIPVLAFEQRFKAAVLVAGGLGQLLVNEMQEGADSVNFLPRITLPVTMLSGENDFVFPLETAQRPLFHGLGTPDEDKRHVIYQGSHYRIPRTELIRDTADWLDRYLGPVRQ
jgi:dienelactone hydrolase